MYIYVYIYMDIYMDMYIYVHCTYICAMCPPSYHHNDNSCTWAQVIMSIFTSPLQINNITKRVKTIYK